MAGISRAPKLAALAFSDDGRTLAALDIEGNLVLMDDGLMDL